MSCVDSFVAAVPSANREAFRQHALQTAEFFRENGALQVAECWGDDVPDGKTTSFPMAVKCRPEEALVFSWIVWPCREVHDAAMPG